MTSTRRLLRLTRAALFGSKPKVQLAPEPTKRRSLLSLLFGKKKPPAIQEPPAVIQEPPAVAQEPPVVDATPRTKKKQKRKTGWFWSRSSPEKAAQNATEPSEEIDTNVATPPQPEPETPEVAAPADAEPKPEPRLSWRGSETRLRHELDELRSERDSALEVSI